MLPPLTSNPPQSAGIADQLGNPAHGLRLRSRSPPATSIQRADVGVQRRREEVAEDPDRRRRRGDVAEEPRVRVEERVIEQQARGPLEQRARIRSVLGQRPVETERLAHRGRRLVVRHGTAGNRLEKFRQLIDEPMPQPAECLGVHGQWRLSCAVAHLRNPFEEGGGRTVDILRCGTEPGRAGVIRRSPLSRHHDPGLSIWSLTCAATFWC